jgi:hypothetical protein
VAQSQCVRQTVQAARATGGRGGAEDHDGLVQVLGVTRAFGALVQRDPEADEHEGAIEVAGGDSVNGSSGQLDSVVVARSGPFGAGL